MLHAPQGPADLGFSPWHNSQRSYHPLNATIQLNASCNMAGKGERGGRFLQRPAGRQDPSPVPDPSPYGKQGTDGTVFRKGEDVTSQLNCHRVRWHCSDRKPIHQRLEPAASRWPSGVVRGPQIRNTGHEERKKKKRIMIKQRGNQSEIPPVQCILI